MVKLSGILVALVFFSTAQAQPTPTDLCRACCQEVYATCKEGHLAGCDDRYNACIKKCRNGSNGKGSAAKEPPQTLIPEIPPNKKGLEKLKK